MKSIYLFIGFISILNSVEAQVKFNDANAVMREMKSFHSISVSNAIDVYISQGGEESLAVSASDQSLIKSIRSEVSNGTLKIWVEGNKWNKNKQNLKAYISFKELDKLGIHGACNVYFVDQIKSDNLKIDMSGASNLKGSLSIDKLVVFLSGASDIKLSGNSNTVQINASGASSLKGFEFVVENCQAIVSGATDIKLTVNKEITGNASGASSVQLKGNAVYTNFKTSGASRIKANMN